MFGEVRMSSSPINDFLGSLHLEMAEQTDGVVATYIPELTRMDPDLFGIAISTLDGAVYAAGDADTPFTIQSVSKPFVMALALQDRGVDGLLAAVGVEPTGDPFNAVALEEGTGRPMNPMLNAGAIVTSALVAGEDPKARSQRILAGLSAFAGRALDVDDRVLRSELATADRNRALAHLMRSMGALQVDVEDALETYCRQCATLVTARDLAIMAATLANGGRNPVTGEQVVRQDVVTYVLSVMLTCGLYEFSGEWMLRTGLPAKSGVGGGITAVLPSQLGIGTFSPRLDAQGNSVRGTAVCEALSRQFRLHVMRPRASAGPPLRRRLHGSQVRSRRVRPARERTVLGSTREIVVYELQGDLTFKEAELISRRAAQEHCRWLILDAARVGRVDPVARRLLYATRQALAKGGVTCILAGPWPPSMSGHAATFTNASDAVESCEDALLEKAGVPGPGEGVPLDANDLCQGMSANDVAALRALGATLDFKQGDPIAVEPDGDSNYALLMITQGIIDMESSADPFAATANPEERRITSRAAGTAVGPAAFGINPNVLRLAAKTDASVVAFTPKDLEKLQKRHPSTAATLYRNAAAALAAENRWSATESVALAS
jgi:glutaminase